MANSRDPAKSIGRSTPALEAICLKAMAHRPEDRYPRRGPWPTTSNTGWPTNRSPSTAIRLRTTRPLGSSTSADGRRPGLLVTAVVALAAIAWLVTRQNMRLDRARREADEQRDRARDSTAMASRAVTEMLDRVARKDLMNVPQAEPLRVELAERALSLYRELDAKNPEDPETRCRLATIEEEVARLYRMIGKHDRAAEVYDSALSHFRDLVAALPRRAQVFPSPGEHPGTVRRATRGCAAASPRPNPITVRPSACAARLLEQNPSEPKYHSIVARTHGDFADMLASAGRLDEAEPLGARAVDSALAYRSSLPAEPDPRNFNLEYAITPMILSNHGSILAKLGRRPEAESLLQQAGDLLRDLRRIYPESNDVQYLLADNLKERAALAASEASRRGESLALLDESVNQITPLLSRFPSIVVYPHFLATVRSQRGATRLEAGRLEEAEEDLTLARKHLARRSGDRAGQRRAAPGARQGGRAPGPPRRQAKPQTRSPDSPRKCDQPAKASPGDRPEEPHRQGTAGAASRPPDGAGPEVAGRRSARSHEATRDSLQWGVE